MKKNRTFEEEIPLIIKGLEKAYEKMVIFKRGKNSPLVVSENGKVVYIPADEIPPTTRHNMNNISDRSE